MSICLATPVVEGVGIHGIRCVDMGGVMHQEFKVLVVTHGWATVNDLVAFVIKVDTSELIYT